jgi:hypothetical protein
VYIYGLGNPISYSDCYGLFTVEGCCNGNEQSIENEVRIACSKIKDKINQEKCPKLAKCLERRCREGKINCKNCKKDIYGTGYVFTNTANLCVNNVPSGLTGEVVIHEWAHTCGWLHEGPGHSRNCGVPCANGRCHGEEGW